MWAQYSPQEETFFNLDIFRMNVSKNAKLKVESYVRDKLNQICLFILHFTKYFPKKYYLEMSQ